MRALPPGKSTWSLRTSSDTSQTPCGSHVGCAPDLQILRPCIHVGAVNLLLRITDEVRADAPPLDDGRPRVHPDLRFRDTTPLWGSKSPRTLKSVEYPQESSTAFAPGILQGLIPGKMQVHGPHGIRRHSSLQTHRGALVPLPGQSLRSSRYARGLRTCLPPVLLPAPARPPREAADVEFVLVGAG